MPSQIIPLLGIASPGYTPEPLRTITVNATREGQQTSTYKEAVLWPSLHDRTELVTFVLKDGASATRVFAASAVDGKKAIMLHDFDDQPYGAVRLINVDSDLDININLAGVAEDTRGNGILSGSFPLSLLTDNNQLPNQSQIRILYRPNTGDAGDGTVVATTTCNADGTWQVSGLNESLKFDIVARIPGFNDVIISDVQPTGAPLSAHFAGIKEEYEYEEEVNIQVVALGGTPPYSYTVNTLPEGLTFDSDTGYITGSMPAGDLMISITVTDVLSDSVTVTWEGTVVSSMPSTIGEFFQGGYYIGDITISDGPDAGEYAVIMAGVESQIEAPWKTTNTATAGTDSTVDGMANTLAMEAAGLAAHPAAKHCREYAGDGHDDWYLPAKDELNLAWVNQAALVELAIDTQYYVSSTQYSASNAWCQHLGWGSQTNFAKNNQYIKVRPVRRLKI